MTLETLFFGLRIYGAAMALVAALIIWLYQRMVANPRFARFARIFWALSLLTGIQRAISIYSLDFFSALNSMSTVALTAAFSTYIFFAVLWEYVSLRRARTVIPDSRDPQILAARALDIIDFK